MGCAGYEVFLGHGSQLNTLVSLSDLRAFEGVQEENTRPNTHVNSITLVAVLTTKETRGRVSKTDQKATATVPARETHSLEKHGGSGGGGGF